MTEALWCPASFTAGELADIAARVKDLGERLRNQEIVERMSQVAREQSKYRMWAPGYHLDSLGEGYAGLILLYSELQHLFPDDDWATEARSYKALRLQVRNGEGDTRPGLFSGTTGWLYLIKQCPEFSGGTSEDNQRLEAALLKEIELFTNSMYGEDRPRNEHYDVLSGAMGLSLLLLVLARMNGFVPVELIMLLFHFAWLGQRDLQRDIAPFERWFVAPEQRRQQEDWLLTHALYGYGMRAGGAGIVALMSLVLMSELDLETSGVTAALRMQANQLRQGLRKGETGWYWPHTELFSWNHRLSTATSMGWCDGTYGSARALWLAGRALQESSLCTLALEVVASANQQLKQRDISDPSLCHGLAGILQICARFLNDTGEPALAEDIRDQTGRLLELFEADRPFGYRAQEPEAIRVDTPWLLEGASGVALALSTLLRTSEPTWDRLFLLA